MDTSILFPHGIVIFSILLNFLLLYIILRRREQLTERFTWLAFAIVFFIIFWIISLDLMYVFDTNNLSKLGFYILTACSYFIGLAVVILLHTFVKFSVQPKLNYLQFSIILSLYFVDAGLLLAYILLGFHNQTDLQTQLIKLVNVIFIFYVLFTVVFMQQDFTRLKLERLSEKQEKQIKLLNIGLVAGLSSQIPVIYISAFVDLFFVLYACFGISIALFIIIQAYLVDPRLTFILPEKTYLLILADQYGTPFFTKNFLDEEDSDEIILVTSTIKSITTILTQFYQVETIPQMLKFNSHLILVQWSKDFYIVVISKQESHLLYSAMRRLENSLKKQFPLFSGMLDPKSESTILQLVEKNFFFIWK